MTIELTAEQRQLATQGSKLWIQGGTKKNPITDAETYGFGALRCATDNLNGDNVEWISYPPDTTHVFCFAYYVTPPPTSGTITVRKEVSLPPDTPAQKLRFTGNISYANNEFFLTASNGNPASQKFIRAGDATWDFTEEVPALATLTAIDCTSKLGSVIERSTTTGRTSVALEPGDDVVCTYKNTFRRPPSGLTLRKVSTGGTGEFDFDIDGEGNTIPNAFARTVEPGLSTLVKPADEIADLPTGTYTVEETTPPDIGGTWALDHVECLPDVAKQDREGDKVSIIVVKGPGTVCTFYNRFTPAGRITLRKITLGGTATTRFQVRPLFGESRPEREQIATTTEEGVPVEATGDSLEKLPIGTYSILETIGGPNRWETASVVCDGIPVPSVKGQFELELTNANPERDCTVTNRRTDIVPPEPPVPPQPTYADAAAGAGRPRRRRGRRGRPVPGRRAAREKARRAAPRPHRRDRALLDHRDEPRAGSGRAGHAVRARHLAAERRAAVAPVDRDLSQPPAAVLPLRHAAAG